MCWEAGRSSLLGAADSRPHATLWNRLSLQQRPVVGPVGEDAIQQVGGPSGHTKVRKWRFLPTVLAGDDGAPILIL